MDLVFFKKRTFFLFLFSFFYTDISFGIIPYYFYKFNTELDSKVDQTISDVCKKFDFDQSQSQTLAYLNRSELKSRVCHNIEKRVFDIGVDFFKEMFSKILERELEFNDNYYVFYHGQQREFIVVQDLYQDLFKLVHKKVFSDFIILRVPDEKFSKFRSVHEFLNEYISDGSIYKAGFDHNPDIRKFLLSVNPSLFGNSYNMGECTFHYFINFENIHDTDFSRLILKIFEHFGLSDLFYKNDLLINDLINFASSFENDKTGLLLQIFIPKELVNQNVYRCKPFGQIYYDNNTMEYNPSFDLENYKNNLLYESDFHFDSAQFRLLINQNILDPFKGVRFFRYCKETKNMKLYKSKRAELIKRLNDQILNGNICFSLKSK